MTLRRLLHVESSFYRKQTKFYQLLINVAKKKNQTTKADK